MKEIWIVLLFFSPSILAFPSLNEDNGFESDDFVIVDDDTDFFLEGFNRHDRQAFSSDLSEPNEQRTIFKEPCLTSKGRLGRCTSLKACYPYFKLHGVIDKDAWVTGLYETCTYMGKKSQQVFGVCCTGEQSSSSDANDAERPTQPPRPSPPPSTTTTTTTTSSPLSKDEEKQHSVKGNSDKYDFELKESEDEDNEAIRVSPVKSGETVDPKFNTGQCGKRFFNNNLKIVNGEEAGLDEFPFMAALFNRNRHFCGGSLIDSRHVLTAAHCVAHMTKSDVRHLRVHLGEYDIKSKYETSHLSMRVQRIIRHKRFSPSTLYNDVAVLTLREPVSFTKAIQPICLAADNSIKYDGDEVTVAGWGTIRDGGPQPRILQKVDVSVWRNSNCAASYGGRAPGGIKSHMLCASRQGKDSCSGDSGGPLFICDGICTQIGIVSWGIGCAREEFPGVYTRVTSLHKWIEKIRKNH